MEAAFQWIADLVNTLKAFVPTWEHVQWTQAAIMVTRGRKPVILSPGIWWYWPFWTAIHAVARVRQTTPMRTELMTQDGHRVTAGVMVRYQIDDAGLALGETWELDDAVVDETTAVLCELVTTKTLAEAQEDRQKFNTALTFRVRAALRGYGVAVERAQLTAFARGIVVIHAGLMPAKEG